MIYTKFILNLIQINISEDISLTVLLLFLMPKCFSKTPFIVPYHIRYKRKMTWKPAMEGKRIKGEKSEMTTMFPTKRTVFILLTWDRKYKDASCGLFFPFKTSGNKTGSWGKWKFFSILCWEACGISKWMPTGSWIHVSHSSKKVRI